MTAIHFNRETFVDTDTIRVHPIITKGGEAVERGAGRGSHGNLRPRQDAGRHHGRQPQG